MGIRFGCTGIVVIVVFTAALGYLMGLHTYLRYGIPVGLLALIYLASESEDGRND